MSVIKEYQVLAGAILITLAIFIYAKQPKYDYVTVGSFNIAVFKDGRLKRFCNIGLDNCFFKQGNEFYSHTLNLKDTIDNTEREQREWEQMKREALPGAYD
ncbi:MAG: hypothetical protein CMH27_03525 [Micavibrio sp.]|nr:hypothetical protein [Micavibrio sp.]|tara:strand:+ start:454 stop:756 length:303 start_codon:yes stop_codon:yes gene_type:complete